jgi:hypothetical protein
MATKKKATPKATSYNPLDDVGFQNAATKTTPKITTPDNTAFGLTASQTPEYTQTEKTIFGVTGPTSPAGGPTGPTGGATGPTSPGNAEYTLNGNQLLYNGIPFGGMRNGVLFVNGYRQDQYNPDGTDRVAGSGLKTTEQLAAETAAAERQASRQSAYDLLYSQFAQYGLESLVEPLKGLITSGASPAEFTIRLRESEPYKKRFAANAQRVAKGLRALDEADYIGLEDQYQEVMRQYGLPESYYTKDATGKQVGFEQLIASDVSNLELGDRLMVAQDRVLKANPEVLAALKAFYPDINNGEILAYTLDPKNAIKEIQRKVTTAEIGGAAIQSGLGYKGDTPESIRARAEELQRYGVDKESATKGFATIGAGLERGSQLASIYKEDPYTQTTAETEVFNIPGAKEARKQRQKITGLEKATFGGQSGISQGALARDRAGAY